jgi:N-acetylneuraminic acid mutarotase
MLATLEAYDPTTNSWTPRASMATSRTGLGATAGNGTLYAVGGTHAAVGDEAALEAYSPGTNTWTTKASMPTPRAGLGVSALNGIIYAVGGSSNTLGTISAVATVESYDPSTDTWTTQAPLPATRADLATTVSGGLLYAAGGVSTGSPVATVTAYQPSLATLRAGGREAAGTPR